MMFDEWVDYLSVAKGRDYKQEISDSVHITCSTNSQCRLVGI